MGMGMSLWEYGFKNMVWLEAEGARKNTLIEKIQ